MRDSRRRPLPPSLLRFDSTVPHFGLASGSSVLGQQKRLAPPLFAVVERRTGLSTPSLPTAAQLVRRKGGRTPLTHPPTN